MGTKTAQKSRQKIVLKALEKLMQLNSTTKLVDLRVPPSNNFKKLEGRNNVYSIRVNKQWRITFEFSNGDFYQVKFEDYH